MTPTETTRWLPPDHSDHVAFILESNTRAVWFTKVGPEGASLAGNVAGSRSRLARAFGTTPQQLLAETRVPIPMKTGRMPWTMTIRTTSRAGAPSATRMAISRCRCATMNVITP